jgi:hypothetical protein
LSSDGASANASVSVAYRGSESAMTPPVPPVAAAEIVTAGLPGSPSPRSFERKTVKMPATAGVRVIDHVVAPGLGLNPADCAPIVIVMVVSPSNAVTASLLFESIPKPPTV